MDRMRFRISCAEGDNEERLADLEIGALKSRLLNLALDWEMAALTLDTQTYKTETDADESLRQSAVIYRKCFTELTDILAAASVLKRKKAL